MTAEILGIDAGELRRALDVPGAGTMPARRPSGSAGGEALRLGGGLWVVAVRDGEQVPVAVETGITDLDRVEITAGLEEGDDALLLPTASLVEIQQQIQNVSSRRGGIPGLTQRPER
jgi:thiazole synthase ThiGH ThiG subunit